MFAIPPDINELCMADAFVRYRDTVGLHVYPVHPPWAEVKDPGKQPAFKKWWDADPHNCNLEKYFKTKRPYNIGACPEPPFIFVDLDSKPDRGASVREYLAAHPELQKIPSHISRGGVHLVFVCQDLPAFLNEHGNRYMAALLSQINEKVTAELFHHPHQNLVLPCSLHPLRDSIEEPYFVYRWERTGDIPRVTWQWLQDTFGFKAPEYKPKERSKKKIAWHLQFQGDLASLDLLKLLGELGHWPEVANIDEGKYSILCPWHTEHSDDNNGVGTSTVIWQHEDDEHWPAFDCKHAHCAKRKLKDLLEWAQSKSPGIVERYCARERVWDQSARKHLGKNDLPRVLHAEDRLESTVYTEVGKLIAPHHAWLNRGSQVVRIEVVPSGFSYSADPGSRYKIESYTPGFRELVGIQAKGLLEKYMEPGVLRKDENEQTVFIPRSFPTDFCVGLVKSDQLKSQLNHISRILTVPLPIRVDNRLVYPRKGFDPQFGTYLLPDAPELDLAMPIGEAWNLIAWLLSGFCFTNEQSRTHAIARLLTPFARALLGWATRVPFWVYIGSRPRCGKDYLAGCTMIIYEGEAFEDLPIVGRDSAAETGKRVLSAARNGRRFMHFSNCEHRLRDTSLTHAITNRELSGRNLGTNDAQADIKVPNEMEYSVSFNLGLIIAPDIAPRSRPIELAFYEEDPNSRTFPDPHLHRTLKANRTKILSAFAAIFRQWEKAGFPNGPTPFASFVEWAEIIGGVMLANRPYIYEALSPIPTEDGTALEKADKPPKGWGDPCLPWGGKFAGAVADRETAAMRALFIACEATHGEKLIKNKAIIECVIQHQKIEDSQSDENDQPSDEPSWLTDQEVDALSYFGRLDSGEEAHGNKINLIRWLRAFNGRILAGIKLKIHPASKTARDLYQFVRQPKPPQPPLAETQRDRTYDSASSNNHNPHIMPVSKGGSIGSTGSINAVYARTKAANISFFPNRGKKENNTYVPRKLRGQNTATYYHLDTYHAKNVKSGSLALDLETYAEPKIGRKGQISSTTDALDPRKAQIRLLTVGDPDGNIRQFDLCDSAQLPPEILSAICSAELVAHNASFELLFLQTKFGILPESVFCTLTASRLVDPQKSVPHSLGPVIERYLDVKLPKEHGASDWGAMVLTDKQLQYARDDVRYLLRLRAVLWAKLEEAELLDVFCLEIALLPVIARMELRGFQVNTPRLASMLSEQRKRSGALEKEIRLSFADPKLNPASPEQLVAAFKKAEIQLENTEEKTLRAIVDPRAALVLEYRGAAKLASSIEGLLGAQCEGRVYARFNPLGAVTGRFSSKGPNLQNITRGPLRSCFIPSSPERRLIIADYSQIELRVAALVANETVMIEAFKRREDLHSKIAAVNLRKPLSDVTRAERGSVGKSTNFGFIYGQGAEGFMVYARTEYGLSLQIEEASRFRNNFFETYPALRAWHEDCWRKAKDNMAEARTIYGRLLRAQADTIWARFNLWTEYVVSGSCADLLKAAMVRIASILPSDVYLVATVHDELIYDAPLDLAEQYCGMIRLAMEEVFSEMFGNGVPIEVESKVCTNWAEK